MGSRKPVRAAGGLVVDDAGQVVVVHRPRYDDWSLPKGKLERGEDHEAAALREVAEETALRCALVQELAPEAYIDHRGRPKTVRWWRMSVLEDLGFVPGEEVDELRWLAPADAAALLTYEHDRRLVLALGRAGAAPRAGGH
ncbi:NUDIX domain-containing protein [Baekduia soli]|uniref:NUDIX domain-containing protein n=1 Tax=Baekduia soli TaxID=496014 RepID=A0A5B8U0M4_9ACTN|nr:NUDIX domain-containing protein [Baekduia soli]QEC46574.1 NUDIX domain-containing protein [Baekduia soli]